MSDLLFPQLPPWLDIQTFQALGQCLSKGGGVAPEQDRWGAAFGYHHAWIWAPADRDSPHPAVQEAAVSKADRSARMPVSLPRVAPGGTLETCGTLSVFTALRVLCCWQLVGGAEDAGSPAAAHHGELPHIPLTFPMSTRQQKWKTPLMIIRASSQRCDQKVFSTQFKWIGVSVLFSSGLYQKSLPTLAPLLVFCNWRTRLHVGFVVTAV